VALAYNPGYYFVLYPLLAIWEPSLVVLRVPAVLAAWGLWTVFLIVARRASGSWRWALLIAGLPLVAGRSFDLYLTKGHGDSLLVLASVLAALALGATASGNVRRRDLGAAILLGCAFWLKQHAALLAIGAALLMLVRDRRASWPAMAALVLLGPIAYLFLAPRLLGPDFLTSTFVVPSSWSAWHVDGVTRCVRFLADWWLVPGVVAGWTWWRAVRARELLNDGLLFLLPFALATGLMGALDRGSSDNVFLLAGVWILLVAARALAPFVRAPGGNRREVVAVCALLASFAFLANDVRTWLPDRRADEVYRDFVAYTQELDGPICAPGLGDFPFPIATTARANWVALEDRIRGPGYKAGKYPFVASMLAPVAGAAPPAYLLTTRPLARDHILGWLADDYQLHEDVSDRFAALRELPCRFGMRAPCFVYRRIEPAAVEPETPHAD
jgi:hypothetical protein